LEAYEGGWEAHGVKAEGRVESSAAGDGRMVFVLGEVGFGNARLGFWARTNDD